MKTGIFGYKGRVSYHCAAPINTWIDELDSSLPKNEWFTALAQRMDREIHRGYQIYPCNYLAIDMLDESTAHSNYYTFEEEQEFRKYIDGQIAKINIPNKDENLLYETILTTYANPLINKLAAEQ
jgi:C-terminal processing protease CtpA/Prc